MRVKNRDKIADFGYQKLLRPLLFRSFGGDPEKIHEFTIKSLALGQKIPGLYPWLQSWQQVSRPVTVAGIRFPNRVGLAAGMDKDGLAAKAWPALGFGFAELGTVTAQSQLGNLKPRIFRLPKSKALINRMGFNNRGAGALAETLQRLNIARGGEFPYGISIGKMKVTPLAQAIPDYLASLEILADYADYFAINISSPNTPGLRSLQEKSALAELVQALTSRARQLAAGARSEISAKPVPIFIKIAPDLEYSAIDDVLEVAEQNGAAGIIATNTTLGRGLLHPKEMRLATLTGGLSGKPLTNRALQVVSYVNKNTGLPIIGVGGITNSQEAKAMFQAGAKLIQLYTGFIYAGPALVGQIERMR